MGVIEKHWYRDEPKLSENAVKLYRPEDGMPWPGDLHKFYEEHDRKLGVHPVKLCQGYKREKNGRSNLI